MARRFEAPPQGTSFLDDGGRSKVLLWVASMVRQELEDTGEATRNEGGDERP